MRFAVATSQATFAVSASAARELSEQLAVARSEIAVIPNGVHPRALPPSTLRHELGLSAAVPIVLAVGNLYPVKGHRFLLEALARMSVKVHLVIAGRGIAEAELLALAADLGMTDRVHLLGLRDDVPNLLAAADVFAQPSLSEGLPVAVLEAMFAGRPIVASDVGDIRLAVGDDGALLVPPGDPLELATAIERLLLQPRLASALGASAQARARDSYGLSAMVERYAQCYAPLIVPRYEIPTERMVRARADRRRAAPAVRVPERRFRQRRPAAVSVH
jgi:glycosyltransferase involved in cell wall biosynthesis